MNENKITKEMFRGTMIVMIIAELSGAITAVIDGMITSRYLGSDMMSAYGIASSYFTIVSIISGVLMIGCQSLAVEAISKGKKEDAKKIVTLSAITGIILTGLITLIMWIAPGMIAVLFGASKGDTLTIDYISDYLRGISIGAPFWFLFVLLTPIVQLDGGGKTATIAAIVMGIVDIVCDILFGIVLDMDLFGMGLATALSHMGACIVMVIFMLSKKSTIKFYFKNPKFNTLPRVIVNGLPRAISMIARTIGPILLNIIVLNIVVGSNIGMTALSVQRSTSFCATSIGWGIGGAMLMIEGLYYNERNFTEFKSTMFIGLKNILMLVVPFSIILFFVSPFIARFYVADYKNNLELYETSLKALRYFYISLPFVAFNVSFASYIQSLNKKVLTYLLNASIECIALVVACYLLSINNGYNGFFLGFFVGEAVLSFICILWFLLNKLIKKNTYAKYMLPDDFIKEGTLIIEKNVYCVDDCVKASEEISDLCANTKLSKSQIYKLSLCVEEMCVNVFTHGFTKDNKKHNVRYRIVIEGDRVVLTLIDDCKMFDITKKLKTFAIDKEHPEKNCGIRMLLLIAKEIHYTNTMNINNLQIIL